MIMQELKGLLGIPFASLRPEQKTRIKELINQINWKDEQAAVDSFASIVAVRGRDEDVEIFNRLFDMADDEQKQAILTAKDYYVFAMSAALGYLTVVNRLFEIANPEQKRGMIIKNNYISFKLAAGKSLLEIINKLIIEASPLNIAGPMIDVTLNPAPPIPVHSAIAAPQLPGASALSRAVINLGDSLIDSKLLAHSKFASLLHGIYINSINQEVVPDQTQKASNKYRLLIASEQGREIIARINRETRLAADYLTRVTPLLSRNIDYAESRESLQNITSRVIQNFIDSFFDTSGQQEIVAMTEDQRLETLYKQDSRACSQTHNPIFKHIKAIIIKLKNVNESLSYLIAILLNFLSFKKSLSITLRCL